VAAVPYCFSVANLPLASRDIQIQTDGGILVYAAYDSFGATTAVNLTRQNSDGAPDPSICKALEIWMGAGNELMLQPDGRFFFRLSGFVAGARYFPDGSPSTNVVNFFWYPSVIQPDQRLVSTRPSSSAVILTRQLLD